MSDCYMAEVCLIVILALNGLIGQKSLAILLDLQKLYSECNNY